MAVNKVIYGGNTLVDLTGDTVTAADLADGVKATGADGNPVIGLMQKVTIDAELSTTSTNPVQNKVIKEALDDKAALNKNNTFSKDNYFAKGMSLIAYRDLDSAIKWYQTFIEPPVASIDATNYTGNAASATKATQDGAGNNIAETYAKFGTANTWTAQQNFHDLMLSREKYTTYVVNGTSDTPITSTGVYNVIGAFTLNLATLTKALSANQSSVFTAYFAANADYTLTITNAGTIKYIGNASDVAITSAGLLLNILMIKDSGDNVMSIVQASKLEGGA